MNIFNHENMQMIQKKEFLFIFALSLLFSGVLWIISSFFSSAMLFLFSVIFLTVSLNVITYLLPWFGRGWIFLLLVSIFTFSIDDVGVTSFAKIILFFMVGLTFELFFFNLKLHIHSIPLDVVLGSSMAMAVFPLSSAFLLSPSLAITFPAVLINLILISFVLGLGASVLTFLLWKRLEHTKPALKLYFYLRR